MKLTVAIFSEQQGILNNQLFDPVSIQKSQWKGNQHWKSLNTYLKEFLTSKNIILKTYDTVDLKSTNAIIYFDLPREKRTIHQLKALAGPETKHLLMIRESPLVPYFYQPKNHDLFDYVLTYNPQLIDNKKYFHYWLPKSFPINEFNKPWEKRKPCVLLNSNYYRGFKAGSRPWTFLVKNYNYKKAGWSFSWGTVIRFEKGFLYNMRRSFVRFCSSKYPEFLDVFGKGWEKHTHSWYYRLFPDKPTDKAVAPFKGDKLELFNNYRFVFAIENFRGNIGYISEKLFDAFYGGTVPIYLGDENITKYIPDECFIDLRAFKSFESLVNYCQTMTKEEWQDYRDAITSFLNSEKAQQFYPGYFANQTYSLLEKCSLTKEK